MVLRLSDLENIEDFSLLGGCIKVLSSKDEKQIQKVADDNAPHDTGATHYYPIIWELGDVTQVSIQYFKGN